MSRFIVILSVFVSLGTVTVSGQAGPGAIICALFPNAQGCKPTAAPTWKPTRAPVTALPSAAPTQKPSASPSHTPSAGTP